MLAQVGSERCPPLSFKVEAKGWGPMPSDKSLMLDTSATYVIRIQGYLDERWSDSMSAASIRVESQANGSPVTTITGEFQDQAALAGALGVLYDLGLPLLSVECIDVEPGTGLEPSARRRTVSNRG